jgi:hypothetical protein
MVGLDADVVAGEAKTDPAPLSPFGEVVARTAGILTYNLRWKGDRYELDFRDSFEISAHPPGDRPNVDVVAEHECGINITHSRASRIAPLSTKGNDDNEHCPF